MKAKKIVSLILGLMLALPVTQGFAQIAMTFGQQSCLASKLTVPTNPHTLVYAFQFNQAAKECNIKTSANFPDPCYNCSVSSCDTHQGYCYNFCCTH